MTPKDLIMTEVDGVVNFEFAGMCSREEWLADTQAYRYCWRRSCCLNRITMTQELAEDDALKISVSKLSVALVLHNYAAAIRLAYA